MDQGSNFGIFVMTFFKIRNMRGIRTNQKIKKEIPMYTETKELPPDISFSKMSDMTSAKIAYSYNDAIMPIARAIETTSP